MRDFMKRPYDTAILSLVQQYAEPLREELIEFIEAYQLFQDEKQCEDPVVPDAFLTQARAAIDRALTEAMPLTATGDHTHAD